MFRYIGFGQFFGLKIIVLAGHSKLVIKFNTINYKRFQIYPAGRNSLDRPDNDLSERGRLPSMNGSFLV
jgi:hypothetical protein